MDGLGLVGYMEFVFFYGWMGRARDVRSRDSDQGGAGKETTGEAEAVKGGEKWRMKLQSGLI